MYLAIVSTFFPISVVAEKFFEHFNASHVRELAVMNTLPVARFLLPVMMFALPASDHRNGIDGLLFIYCLLYSEREHSIINRTLFCCQTIFVLPNNIHERICINQPLSI